MKIYDAVYTAAVFLQLDELCDGLNSAGFSASDPSGTLSAEQARELDILVRCCNLALHELSESFPLRGQTEVAVRSGGIPYADLPSGLMHVYGIEQNGKRLAFTEEAARIAVRGRGKATVLYSVRPPAVCLHDVSPYPADVPSARLLSYGIAREYCLISGMTDDAALWDGRFTACALDEGRARREKRVRARVWR